MTDFNDGARVRTQGPRRNGQKTKAYAVLAGGGVKGAALVGALQAAEDWGFEFEGYGGASAGSIVALFASILPERQRAVESEDEENREEDDPLYQMIVNQRFNELFDGDNGVAVTRLRQMRPKRYVPWAHRAIGDSLTLNRIRSRLGLYEGSKFENFIHQTVTEKVEGYEDLKEVKDFSFDHLRERGGKLLKIVASDVSNKKVIIYPRSKKEEEAEGAAVNSVVRAVRASVGFPFVFRPVKQSFGAKKTRYLVDGGLCSNLPVFLFADEHKKTGFPILAFDLISKEKGDGGGGGGGRYRFWDFCGDLLQTALGASDEIHRRTIQDLTGNRFCYVPIRVSAGTFEINLDETARENLYNAGYRQASRELRRVFTDLPGAATKADAKKSVLNVPDSLIAPLLRGLVQDIEEATHARDLRAHVMLPVAENRLAVTYQYGMREDDPDRYMEVGPPSKWLKRVFQLKQPTISNFAKLRGKPDEWGMSPQNVGKIRDDRKAMISVPILKLSVKAKDPAVKGSDKFDCIGILSVDTGTPAEYTSWDFNENTEESRAARRAMKKWADIILRMLY